MLRSNAATSPTSGQVSGIALKHLKSLTRLQAILRLQVDSAELGVPFLAVRTMALKALKKDMEKDMAFWRYRPEYVQTALQLDLPNTVTVSEVIMYEPDNEWRVFLRFLNHRGTIMITAENNPVDYQAPFKEILDKALLFL